MIVNDRDLQEFTILLASNASSEVHNGRPAGCEEPLSMVTPKIYCIPMFARMILSPHGPEALMVCFEAMKARIACKLGSRPSIDFVVHQFLGGLISRFRA